MADFTIHPEKEPSKAARGLAEQVERDGGRVLAVYQEPVGEHWQIFCLLPRAKVEASPYQRDVSPTHAKRLTEAVRRVDRFRSEERRVGKGWRCRWRGYRANETYWSGVGGSRRCDATSGASLR